MLCFFGITTIGALDKYFDQVMSDIDEQDGDIDEDDLIDDNHRDSDVDEMDDVDDIDDETPPMPQCSLEQDSQQYIVQDISFSDLVIMRDQSENDNENQDKFAISITQSSYKE